MTDFRALPASLWQQIRAAYEGRDRSRQTSQQIRVEQLAAEFGVHANTIYLRVYARMWKRPAWYTQGGPKRPANDVKLNRLIFTLRQAAKWQAPCPSEPQLAAAIEGSGRHARFLLQKLVHRDSIKIEYLTPRRRRIVFPDGMATDWTALTAATTERRPGSRERNRRPNRKPESLRGPSARTEIDVGASAAVTCLRRRGLVVFDCGIHTGQWRERWSIDGRIVDRDALLQLGAQS